MTDAPFVIRPPNAHNLSSGVANTHTHGPTSKFHPRHDHRRSIPHGSSFGTVFGDGKIDGTLYWNHDGVFSGLVCGSSSKEVVMTVMQMVRLHLNEGRGSSALIFHASGRDHLLPPRQVSTIQIARRLASPSVFLTPQLKKDAKQRYADVPMEDNNILPLRFAEKDITLAHILSLCTPSLDYPGRDRILSSVQYIVSKMADPFSIQEFNKLVDEEQWDEHGSSFMALRQTLLTTLVSSGDGEGKDVATRMKNGDAIIIDLSDPVLRSTGIDSILFDMVLCLYCVIRPDSRKLLVLDQAHEYMNTDPALINTLVTLLSMHSDSPLKSLISTSDVTQISPRLISHLDYLICHDIRSPSWLKYLQSNYSFNVPSPPDIIFNLESRHAIIVSPRSVSELHRGDNHDEDRSSRTWGPRAYRVEIGWEWPLTVEQQKIEQLQALVAQLSNNAVAPSIAGTTIGTRRSRKESSTYLENTMGALRNALGYLAARRAVDLNSPPISPRPVNTTQSYKVSISENREAVVDGSNVPTPKAEMPPREDPMKEVVVNSEPEPLSDIAEWMLKPFTPDHSLAQPPAFEEIQDLGPFNPTTPPSLPPIVEFADNNPPVDKVKLSAALSAAIVNAGGELGVPVSSYNVGQEFHRLLTAQPNLISTSPEYAGFATWAETVTYANREGILKVINNGNEQWVVMQKASTDLEGTLVSSPAGMNTGPIEEEVEVVPSASRRSSDGWYEARRERAGTGKPPTIATIKTIPQFQSTSDMGLYEPLIQAISSLKEIQPTSPLLLHSVSYELKRRFPTAIRDAGYKSILEYLHGAQAKGLIEIHDDPSGSIYVQPRVSLPSEAQSMIAFPRKMTNSPITPLTDRFQPESSPVATSDMRVAILADKYEPLLAVLRSLRKHDLYKVTLSPLSLSIEKMFPGAMERFGFNTIDAYVADAHEAGVVITGVGQHGRTWVSLPDEHIRTPTMSTPIPRRRVKSTPSLSSLSDFPHPPPRVPAVPDFSRLLRAVRALSSPGHERVLCSRVGMLLNKEDYRAMHVETFNQCLIAAAKANLVVHGGFGGQAWVALRGPDLAGVTERKIEEPRAKLVKTAPPEIATNPVVPSGSAYKLPLSEKDIEAFRPLLTVLRTFIHGKHIAEPFRTVVEKHLLKTKPDVLTDAKCNTMDEYILRAQSYGLVAQIGHGKASRLRLLENSGLAFT